MQNNQKKAGEKTIAVAIDKDKSSQYAIKWAIETLAKKGQSITLIHVAPNAAPTASAGTLDKSNHYKEIFTQFECFCRRRQIQCKHVLLNGSDIAQAIIDHVFSTETEMLVVGAPSKGGFLKFTDVASSVSKGAPDFCTVYVVTKGKLLSMKEACAPVKNMSPNRNLVQNQGNQISEPTNPYLMHNRSPTRAAEKPSLLRKIDKEDMEIKSPFTRGRASSLSYGELSIPESDISFVSSGRPSTDQMFPSFTDSSESTMDFRLSSSSDQSFGSSFGAMSADTSSSFGFSSSSSLDTGKISWSSQSTEDVEAEMRRLKLELKQTMEMYSSACKEALTAKQKAIDLQRWNLEEQQKLEEARLAGEAALALAEKEKGKYRAAMERAEASQRIAELEAQKRKNAEIKALKEAEEKRKAINALSQMDARYRKYTIEEIEEATEFFSITRKIGEGGYGPVYKCYLDHTPVAVKVLRPDAAQGRSQFQQEVEVLSCIRHPNMVLLLGACPEYGCLVYEYMANGSLEDRLFRRGNSPVLPWQLRFRISAEIATGLLFLHQTKPEPLVHRDLKPGNILLDRNYVSKISDVGLARLVPPAVADHVTQYRMTSTAGTFCYIDPEYQQTGMLGIKSDIYSLGVMLLQIITAKPPMGLTHHVERAIERGTFAEVLDPAVQDWPVEQALKFAKLALQCAELRRKDRPDLGNVVLPELNGLRMLADQNPPRFTLSSTGTSPQHSHVSSSSSQDVMSDTELQPSGNGYDSSKSRSSTSSYTGKSTI